MKVVGNKLVLQKTTIPGPFSGNIIAFELDPRNTKDIELLSQANEDFEEWQDKDEQIFVIDEKYLMYHCYLERECEQKSPPVDLSRKNEIRNELEMKV